MRNLADCPASLAHALATRSSNEARQLRNSHAARAQTVLANRRASSPRSSRNLPSGWLVFSFSLLLACLLSLTGCFGIPSEPKVAASVNGEKILEDDVTSYIEGFRSKNPEYETDTGWAEFLKSNGYTSETMRIYVLDTVFIPKTLIRQECESRNIKITDAELDSVIQKEKSYYEQRYGDNSWDSVLASYGYDEDTWRENERDRLLEEKLAQTVITDAQPTQGEIQALANQTASNYNGKSSYYIEFETQELASAARNRLAMNDSVTSLEAFSTLGSTVYAGWNSLTSSRDAMNTEYIQSLNSLALNQVSQPVQIDGKWLLIFCNATFNAGSAGESVALDTIPPEIYEQLVSDATENKTASLFDEWLEDLTRKSKIVYEPMPEGLAYSVNVTLEGE